MPIRRIYADIKGLLDGAATLVLDADAAAGASTITVKSILGVSTNKILLFREPGNEHAEIVATHASTSPSGNTVTLASTLVESHPAGTVVYLIPANQVRFYHSSTEADANSDDSSLSALAAATAIDPTTVRNYYDDTAQTSGYYYYRFIDSINSINLLYSDPIPWAITRPRFNKDEVGYLLEFVMRKLGAEYNEQWSKETAIDEITACLSYIQGKLKHWSQYLQADYVVGQTSRGVFEFDMPTSIYDNNSNKSVLEVRIGTDTIPLIYRDEREFNQLMGDAIFTDVRTQATAGQTSLNIDNSYDFDDSGTVHIYTSGTDDAITYTGVTRSATSGVLTGVPASGDGAIGTTHAVDTKVWQNPQEGKPTYFTVREGKLRIWPLCDSTWKNKNIIMDFYEQATTVDSESDTVDAPRYDMVKHWLLWKAKGYLRNNGKDDLTDSDYLIFRDILSDAIRKEVSGQKFKMAPKINSVTYRPKVRGKFENT